MIVGLGNPGKEYENNRHNIGYLICDQITKSQKSKVKSQNYNLKVKILKPQTFMNRSGEEVKKKVDYYKIEPKNVFVVHDDLDLEFGTVRFSFGSVSAGHNGVQSIIDKLSTNEFWRVRVGIGRPPENIPADKFVLQDFSDDEKEKLSLIIDETASSVLTLLSEPKEKTVNI